MSAKKPDVFQKVLFDEPAHEDAAEVLAARLQDAGINSVLAEPTSRFLGDLYAEGITFIRMTAEMAREAAEREPAARKNDSDSAEHAGEFLRSATFLEVRSGEVRPFLERTSALLDKKVDEDDELTEAFEKNVARYEKLGRLESAGALMVWLSGGSDAATLHGSWAISNVYVSLVKLIGILELLRFERVSPTTMMDALSEILLDLNHRLRPGLVGSEEGRTGLVELLSASRPENDQGPEDDLIPESDQAATQGEGATRS